jgi:predicted ATP-dependent endonuclease of OLD family
MKISKINIKDFFRFKDFTLDLTYPKGHDKAGKPLDKICFIGQSGTGKTTLLELIPLFTNGYKTNLINKYGLNAIFNNVDFNLNFGFSNEYSTNIHYENAQLDDEGRDIIGFSREWENSQLDGNDITVKQILRYFYNWQNDDASKLIYFPANLNYDLNADTESKSDDREIVDFSRDKISNFWKVVLEDIQNYQERELKIRQDISRIAEKSSNNMSAIVDAVKKLEEWKELEFNPIKDIADNCLDPLLEPFKLRVKRELDFKIRDDIGFIQIEDFWGNHIPYGLWSTGTKQIILNALPLYLLKPKNTIILFDEPERSLYPNIQKDGINIYKSFTNNCQLIFATHSPIISASFDPWEVVELKFDKDEKKVYRETYFEGENHVDNYKWNPKYMRWDDILQRVFDLEDDGSPDRKIKLDELATLNVKFKKLTKQGQEHSVEALEIIKNIEKLSKDLSKWD